MYSTLLARPVLSLLQHWQIKVPIALLTAWAWSAAQKLLGAYDQLLATDPYLVIMAISVFCIDWATGIAAAVRRGEIIQTWSFRQGAWKFLEYVAVVMVCVMLANAGKGHIVETLFKHLDEAALFYVGLTESWSVIENTKGIEWAQGLFGMLQGNPKEAMEGIEDEQ